MEQGSCYVQLTLDFNLIVEEIDFLEKTISNFNLTCTQLVTITNKIKCDSINANQMNTFDRLIGKNDYIKTFFTQSHDKRSWEFCNWMDDDDRVRVDMNTDKLRGNEEK